MPRIKQTWFLQVIDSVSWIISILIKINYFLHSPYFNVYITQPIVDRFFIMTFWSSFWFLNFIIATINFELITMRFQWILITFNKETLIFLKIRAYKTKTLPTFKHFYLFRFVTKVILRTMPCLNPLWMISFFIRQLPINDLLRKRYIKILTNTLIKIYRPIVILLLPEHMVRKKLCLIQIDSFTLFNIIMCCITTNCIVIFSCQNDELISYNIKKHYWNNNGYYSTD